MYVHRQILLCHLVSVCVLFVVHDAFVLYTAAKCYVCYVILYSELELSSIEDLPFDLPYLYCYAYSSPLLLFSKPQQNVRLVCCRYDLLSLI